MYSKGTYFEFKKEKIILKTIILSSVTGLRMK